MVHNVVQPDLIDSLATTHGYSYLLDMFSSPLLQPQQEVVEEMTTEEGNTFQKYLATNCDSNESSRQTSTSAPEETLRQTEGCSKPLDDNFNTNSLGSGQAPDIPKETQAAEPKPPKRPRQKGLTWTQTEHELFLEGMEKYGRGDWKSIANTFVLTRTPAQVASHAQKYFGRLKKAKKPSAGHRGKSMAFKGSLPMTMSIFHPTTCVPPSNYAIVHPTFYVPPSDNGNVPSTYSNPPMDFGNVPLSFTNPLSEESRKVFATNSFPSAGSSTFTLIEPFRPFKFAKVYPTTYVPSSNSSSRVYPTIYVPPLDNNDLSFEDVYQPSMDFITNPTSNNTINHPTTHIPSQDSITAPSSTEINVHPDPFFPLLDFLNDPCLGSTSVPPTNPVTPLNSSFADPEENPTLDFLYAPQLNVDADVQNTLQVPRSVISTSDPTLPMPQNDFGYVEPTVSDPFITEYYTVNHPDSFTSSAAACQTIPISPHDVACMEQMFAEEHFFHENCGFMEFNGM